MNERANDIFFLRFPTGGDMTRPSCVFCMDMIRNPTVQCAHKMAKLIYPDNKDYV